MCIIKSNSDQIPLDLLKSTVRVVSSTYNVKFRNILFHDLNIEMITDLNRKSLKHNYATDVITFTYIIKDYRDVEIFYSSEYVLNSLSELEDYKKEIHRLFIHGLLHSIGFSDETSEEKLKMTKLENQILEKFTMFHVKH